MKKINFLAKLAEENKLKIIEPNDNMKESYIQKASHSLNSSSILLSNNEVENAVPLAYYSMYNMLTALLYKIGIKCENHSASIILLKNLFKLDNSKITFAKKERLDKQYYVDFELEKEDVEKLIESAKEFNSILYDFIEKLTSEDIAKYKKKLNNLIK